MVKIDKKLFDIFHFFEEKKSNNIFDVNFHHQGGHDPKVRGTVGSSLSKQFHRHLKILNPIIFGYLAAVLANVHRQMMMQTDRQMDFARRTDVPELHTGHLIIFHIK